MPESDSEPSEGAPGSLVEIAEVERVLHGSIAMMKRKRQELRRARQRSDREARRTSH